MFGLLDDLYDLLLKVQIKFKVKFIINSMLVKQVYNSGECCVFH